MALYKCEVTFEIVVSAQDDKEAIKMAEKDIYKELDQSQDKTSRTTSEKIVNVSDLPKNWENCVPWGDEEYNRTCLDILIDSKYKHLICSNVECENKSVLIKYKQKIFCKTCLVDLLRTQ